LTNVAVGVIPGKMRVVMVIPRAVVGGERHRAQWEKRADTVGQPPNVENHASDMPSLKAPKSLESNAVTAAVSRGNRMTNSIRAITLHIKETCRGYSESYF
jgi:hypothetical protein